MKILNSFIIITMMFLTQACQVKSTDSPGDGIFSGHQPTANAFTLSTNLNRTYFPGENIEFSLSFPKNVAITGNPTLALTIGATARTATFFSGNNTSTLVFRYTVMSGDNDTDGITVGTSLGMSGATCTYDSTNACGTTIQLPNLANVRVLSNVPPVANNISPPAFNEDTQSIITLSYTDSEGDLATTCALSGLVKVVVSQACACDGAGVCTVGITGTPNANGAGSFNYTVTANGQLSNSASSTFTITPVPDAPIAYPVNPPSFDEGTQSIITLNYSDGDNDLATSCSVSSLTNVTVSQACACSSGICTVGVTGSPLNYNGAASFNYTVTANAQISNTAPVNFNIDDISNPPVANNITPAPFNEDTQSVMTLSYTDSDGDLAVSCAIVSPTNVTVTQACACDGAGVCTVGVTGTTNFNGGAGFGYTVNTGANSNTANATFTITAVDDAPTTTNINPPAFDENTESIITLPYNDVENDTATTCAISGLNNVTVTTACACAAGTCSVGVTGTLNYSGAASFDFSVTANSATSNISTANFTINDIDAAPVADNISPPSFNEDTQSVITLSYTDSDGDLATVCAISSPTNVTVTQACACDGLGVCTVGVTGTSDYFGAASFAYTVTANSNTSNVANASLMILPIDDAPVASNITPPNFDKNTESIMTLSYTDVDSDLATACAISNLSNVTVTTACACDGAGVCTVGVTGTSNYFGPGSFDFTVTANSVVSNVASSSFTIDDIDTAPVADNITPAAFNEDVQSVITLSYSDVDTDLATSCAIASPTNVTVTEACACDGAGVCTVGVTGSPLHYNGAASFNYTVTANGQASNSASATLSITAVDDAPVASNITPPNFDKNTESIMTLSYTDVETDLATVCSISNLSNVTVTTACACDGAGVCTVGVTGTSNYSGAASFDYTVTANSLVSNIASSSFTIDDTNTAPVADNITPAAFNEDVQSVITLSYSDVDTDLASSCAIASPTNVTVTQACACDGAGVCTVGVTGSPLHYNGAASFNYTVTANGQVSNSASATLSITAVDDAPVASNITPPNFDKNTESIMTLSYSDVETHLATVCSISNLSNVTVTTACACDGAGVCTVGVTGTNNYSGAASFDFTVTANALVSNVAFSSFTIDDTNTAPVADNISPPAFNEDTQSVITLSYSDVDGDLASTCAISSPTNVTVTQACACDGLGVCTVGITGTSDYNGAASFNYTVDANTQTSNSALASLVVLPIDDAPVASNITPPNFNKNTESIMTLSYTDVDSDLATVCSISNLSNVTVTTACTCDGAGVCTVGVTGTNNYFGAASFDYTVTANAVVSNVATSSFTIDDTNTAPVADNITPAAFNEDTQSVITLSYSDVDTDLATSCAIASPTNVTVTQACACDGAGVCTVGVTGSPLHYNGAASFNYTVTANAQASNSASATLSITAVDDAPVASNITPANFNKNTESVMTLSYSDADSDLASVCAISNLSNVTVTTPCACDGAGVCTVGVTGTSNYFGAASFDYTVTANSVVSNVASSSFTIDDTNTAPVADNITPAAFNEDVQSVITLSYSDVDTDLATSCAIASPTNVTVTQACACDGAGVCTVGVTGSPLHYNGAASFNYTVTANGQASNSASATLSITAVDDAPVASNITPPNFDKNTQSVMTLSYSDVESDLATVCAISNLSNVTVTQACACDGAGVCTVGVTGTSNYFGAASFDYTVTANAVVSNVASSSFTIDNTNTPPVAENLTPAAFNEDVQSVITLSYSDVDTDLATSCAIASPTNVTVTQACACDGAGVCTVGVTGSPLHYNGAASFNYTVTANTQASNSASATLSITAVDDAPVASNITPPNFDKNTQSVMTLSYSDVESDLATVCAISNLSNVTVTQACACDGAGVCTVGVTGTFNYFGAASFDYTVTANSAVSNVASSTFTIDDTNTAPVADNITPAAFNEDVQSVITLSYTDVDTDLATSCAIASPTNVTVTQACACDGAGVCTVGVTGSPLHYNGAASFNYTVTANSQVSNSASATLSITAVDDAPVASNITPPNFDKNTESVMTLSYSDADSDLATVCSISNLSNVTVTTACACDGAGVCTVGVTGTSNYFGAASFDYTVTANAVVSNVASSSFTIDNTNTPPVAENITPAAFNEDVQSVITLSYSDVDTDLATSCAIASPTNVTVTQACACDGAGVCTVGVTGSPLHYNGAASFNYTVTANTQASNSASATLTITAVDDAPVASNITPADFGKNTQSIMTLSYTDVESDQATTCSLSNLSNVTVTQACACAAGTCTVGVTGTSNYTGAASFDYTVTANLVSNVASSTFNIIDNPPVADNITPAAFNEDTQSVITLSYSDADGDQASACTITSPTSVTVTQACACAAGTCTVGVTGSPLHYNGAASFNYTVTAGGQASNSATATLSITAVDDAPVASNITPPNFNKNTQSVMTLAYTDEESDQATSCAISNLSNVTVTQACACAAGTCTVGVTGTFNYFGPGSFDFTVTANSATSNLASSSFTIDNSNTPPVADNISPAAFNEDTQSVITLSYSDVDLDQATTCSIASPTNVTVTQACACASGTCTVGVTGTTDYNGAASFNYTVTAGGQPSNSATATLSITAVDDKPVGVPLTPAAFNEDTQSPGISLTYTDVEGDQATSCTISNLTNVTVTSACTCSLGACTVAVTGTAHYYGTASFDYTVTANGLTSDPKPVSLTITSVSDAPTTANITPPAFNEDTQSVITLTHTAVGGDTATSCAVTSPVNVTVTQACACSGGVCTVGVTGTADYFGSASFQWTVSSGSAQSISRNAALTINAVNDPPVISVIATQTTPVDTAKAVTFTFTDVDNTLTCTSARLSMTSSATTIVQNSGVAWSGTAPNCTATITPVNGAIGSTTLTFNGNDGSGGNTNRAFTFTVNGASLRWYDGASPISSYDFGIPGTNTTKTVLLKNVGNQTSGAITISELLGENRIGTDSTCGPIAAGASCSVIIYWQEANPKRVKTETFEATDGSSTTPILTVTGEKA